MLKLKLIIFLILIGVVGKANIPAVSYFESSNKLKASISKPNTNDNNIFDFVFEEPTIEEEEESGNETNQENFSNYTLTSYYNFLYFATNTFGVCKKQPYNCISKKQFTTIKLYLSFSNIRI